MCEGRWKLTYELLLTIDLRVALNWLALSLGTIAFTGVTFPKSTL